MKIEMRLSCNDDCFVADQVRGFVFQLCRKPRRTLVIEDSEGNSTALKEDEIKELFYFMKHFVVEE